MRSRSLLKSVCFLLASVGVLAGGIPADAQSNVASEPICAESLAAAIDRHVSAMWQQQKIEQAAAADDAEFLRRTYLNIVGRIPTVNEAFEFLDSSAPGKRQELVEQLLDSPGYLSNFTSFWRDVIIPEVNNSADNINRRAPDILQFEAWLRDRLERNHGFDQVAREVISGTNETPSEGNTGAFLRLKESKPENLAAATSRAFLGVRLECAQCHNHPFAKWRREDFWKMAAFYGGVQTGGDGLTSGRKIKIPELDQEVEAVFLDGSAPDFKTNGNPRIILAKWVTAPENNYFAESFVNRLWGHFFGVGIVEPVDDFDERNPSSHPQLLKELAHVFVVKGFDQKLLIRAITSSQAYQLTSRRSHPSQENPRYFARMIVKGMNSDQLFNSLIWATGTVEQQPNQGNFVVFNGEREKFRELFGQQVSAPGEVQTSILQALLMLNGTYVDQATSPDRGRTLSAIIEAPFLTNEERIETLYLAALARPPRASELSIALKYIDENGASEDWTKRLGDVYWALLNSSEFLLNH